MNNYVNLCVKADAMSLLPVTVCNHGQEHEIEEVASVSVANDRHLLIPTIFGPSLFFA